MAKAFKIGDHVSWKSEAGRASGTIIAIHTKDFLYKAYVHSPVSGRRRRACALASVRRSNCTCRFPAYSFHEDSVVPGCQRRN